LFEETYICSEGPCRGPADQEHNALSVAAAGREAPHQIPTQASAAQRHGTASDFFFFSSPPLFPRLQRSGEQVVGKQGKGRREAQYLWVEEEVESAKRATTTWWRWRSPSGGWSLSSPKAGGAIKKQPAAAGRPTAANRP